MVGIWSMLVSKFIVMEFLMPVGFVDKRNLKTVHNKFPGELFKNIGGIML